MFQQARWVFDADELAKLGAILSIRSRPESIRPILDPSLKQGGLREAP